MRLLRRKVGAKIILGYLIVIALMTVIGELALFRLDEISATVFNLTERLAGDWALSNEVANRIILARLYANQYVASHQQTALDQFRAEMTTLQNLLARFDAPGIDPARHDRFAPIHADVNAYDAAFEQAAALIMDQDEVQSQVLDVKGLVIDNQLAALRIGLNALNDPSAFLSLGNAQNAFQLMRLNAAKYLTAGTIVTLTATPLITSTFSSWSGDVMTTTNPVTVTMTSNKIITATFALKQSHIFLPMVAR